MSIQREYWSDFDSSLFISKLRSSGSRSGSATTDGSDEVSTRVISIDDPGFNRDIGFDRTIGNAYVLRKGGYQPVEVTVKFLMNDSTMHNYALNVVTQGAFNTARLSNSITPCKIRLQFETKDAEGSSSSKQIYKRVYYNAYPKSFSTERGDTTELIGVLTFLVSPFNEMRLSNYREAWKESTDNLANFKGLEYSNGNISNWDVQMGYSTLV